MPKTRVEVRIAEIRAEGDGRTVTGTVVRYGDEARIGVVRERIMPGAFAPLPADVLMDVQHERGAIIARTGSGLTLQDDDDSLRFIAELPDTPRAAQALADVKAGLLRGASVAMEVTRERWEEGALRVIEKARIVAVSLVDSGAYPDSVISAREARLVAQDGIRKRRHEIPRFYS